MSQQGNRHSRGMAHVAATQPSSVTLRLSPDRSVSSRTIAYLVSVRVSYIAPRDEPWDE